MPFRARLLIHGNCHVSFPELQQRCIEIKRQVEARGLDLRVYSTCFGVNEPGAIDAMIDICTRTDVKYFRVTLPLAGVAAVRNLGSDRACVPSYREGIPAGQILRSVRLTLQQLARRTKLAGVCALLEIHWGTVMSSFTSAHALVRGLDPEAISITFDPANMVIEGKEDWEYGIDLLREHLVNVHIKNASWVRERGNWTWQWDGLQQGMVEWPQLFRLLASRGYRGMDAYENAIGATATPDCPWYVVPADNKWFTRIVVASAIIQALDSLDLKYPRVGKEQLAQLQKTRAMLMKER